VKTGDVVCGAGTSHVWRETRVDDDDDDDDGVLISIASGSSTARPSSETRR